MLNDRHGAFLQTWCFMLFSQKWLPSKVSICYSVILSSQYLKSIIFLFCFVFNKAYQQILQGTSLWMENLQFIFPLLQIGRSYTCTVYSVALESDEFAELNNSMNPYSNFWCCIFNVLYCLYNINLWFRSVLLCSSQSFQC